MYTYISHISCRLSQKQKSICCYKNKMFIFAWIDGAYSLIYSLNSITSCERVKKNVTKECSHLRMCPLFFLQKKKIIHTESKMKMFKFRPRRVSSVSGRRKKKKQAEKYLFYIYAEHGSCVCEKFSDSLSLSLSLALHFSQFTVFVVSFSKK